MLNSETRQISYNKTNKKSKDSNFFSKIFIYFFLVTGFFNTILRLSIDSDLTIFRVLLPFSIIALYNISKSYFYKFIKTAISFIIFSIILCVFYGSVNNIAILRVENIIFIFHYLSILLTGFLIFALSINPQFYKAFYRFLYVFFIITILVGLIEWQFGIKFPFTSISKNSIGGFYWTENEYSVAIVSFMPLLMFKMENKFRFYDLCLFFLTILFVIINDSRVVLLSFVFQILLLVMLRLLYNCSSTFKIIFIFISIFIFIFTFYILYQFNYIIEIGQGISIRNDLIEPIIRILTLNPFSSSVGSINARVNATIYGIKELISSFFLGIGPGNSFFVMEKYGITASGSAASMHNFIMQSISEIGIMAILFLFLVIKKLIKKAKTKNAKKSFVKSMLVFMITFPVFSLSSSSGFFSMFYVFSIFAFYLCTDYSKNIFCKSNLKK